MTLDPQPPARAAVSGAGAACSPPRIPGGAARAAALANIADRRRSSSSTTASSGRARCAARAGRRRGARAARARRRDPGIAVAIDGNGRRVAADPYRGTIEAVLECAANLACAGAEPLGLTNCLNFGNPEKPHIAWQLTESVRGLGDACRALGIPVVGGNVSLYNEGAEGPIYPTPVVGLVGELPDVHAPGGRRSRPRATGSRSSAPSRRRSAHRSSRGWAAPSCPRASAECDIAADPRDAARRARRGPRGRALERPRHRRGRPRDGARGVLPGGRDRRAGRLADTVKPLRALFGEAPGGFIVSGRSPRCARSASASS